MSKIVLLEDKKWAKRYRRFRAINDFGFCEFTIWEDNRTLGSFGGSEWPNSFPEFFEHFGPDKGQLTARSFYRLRDDVVLPEEITPYAEVT